MSQSCPLCGSLQVKLFHQDRYRTYYACADCSLVHVPKEFHLSHDKEKRRYDLHQNDPCDAGYRRFLCKLIDPLVERLQKGDEGLDYGSGPEPVLAAMLCERGYKMGLYDPYYAGDATVLKRQYDFLTCCETIEHFSNPAKEWEKFMGLVKKGGWIGIMTQMIEETDDFARWHYINDETHISFFCGRTFEWLGNKYGVEIVHKGTSVVLCHIS